MTLRSTTQSPRTVKRKARELTTGTVRLNSACPINRKNHTDPVRFILPYISIFTMMVEGKGKKYKERDEISRMPQQVVHLAQ